MSGRRRANRHRKLLRRGVHGWVAVSSEIAEMLNEPLGTIKGRIRLGMDKIRATLAEGW